MVKQEDLNQLHGDAARAILIARKLIVERDNVIALVKHQLMTAGISEKEALAYIFKALHGGASVVPARRSASPYGQMENLTNDRNQTHGAQTRNKTLPDLH